MLAHAACCFLGLVPLGPQEREKGGESALAVMIGWLQPGCLLQICVHVNRGFIAVFRLILTGVCSRRRLYLDVRATLHTLWMVHMTAFDSSLL